jgi:hypothetical protein
MFDTFLKRNAMFSTSSPYAMSDYRLRVGGVLPPNTGRDVIMTSLYV